METITTPRSAAMLLSANDAAKALSISTRTLWSLTANGEIPAVRIGRLVRYRPETLRDWLASREQAAAV